MKKYFILVFTLLPFISVKAQITDSVAYLNVNQINALIAAGGMNFCELPAYNAAFEYPAGSGKTTIFSSTLWIGAKHNGQLHLAGETYRSSGRDFFPGPVMDAALYDSELPYWNKLWQISQTEIDDHIANWNTGGYVVPSSIASWPVYGNTSAGMNGVQAPFVDTDADGVYHPELGDYPAIRGDYAIYFILNDSAKAHTHSSGNVLGVEVHGMAYAYNTIPELEKTIFINYLVYNRSARTYDSLYFGSFTDMDLGFYGDDYVGCDSSLWAYYVYNANAIDNVYGANPPVQAVKWMNLPMTGFSYFNNAGAAGMADPTTADQYYNYLTGKWKDGQPIIYGGNGYPSAPEDTVLCNYVFPGYPNDTTQWNEVSAGNTPGDRRGLGISGPYSLAPGGYISFDLAFVIIDSSDAKPADFPNIENMLQVLSDVQQFFDNTYPVDGADLALSVYDQDIMPGMEASFVIYPNPTNDKLTISTLNYIDRVTVEIVDMEGRLIQNFQYSGNENTYSVSDLQQGMYLIRFIMNSQTQYRKFVKL